MNRRSISGAVRSLVLLYVLFAAFALPARAEQGGLQLLFLDVGQGDATLISRDGEHMLVDAGPPGAWDHIAQALAAQGVTKLKYLVATHPHQDHIGNIPRALENFPADAVLLPPIEHATATYDRMIRAICESGAQTLYPAPGDTFSLGGARVTVYAPHPVAYANPNDWSIVLMIRDESLSALLCADAEYAAERDMLAESDAFPLKADILRVAHHGSDSSSSPSFIEAVAPEIAVISCAEEADVETAMALTSAGVQTILTTRDEGDILIDKEALLSYRAYSTITGVLAGHFSKISRAFSGDTQIFPSVACSPGASSH